MALIDYQYNGAELQVTEEMIKNFEKHGYLFIRNILSADEMAKLKTALEYDEGILTKAYDVMTGDKLSAKMCLWNHPGNDITGMIGRCEKIAGTMETLLGGEVYHYHTKLMMKEPIIGGNWVWHQDYGYWYDNGALRPDMGTCFIAVDKCSSANGCIEVIPGSHTLGRIEHGQVGGQMQADAERVEQVIKELGEPVPVTMNPGDALFFHSNVLHRSAANTSEMRRWAFLVAYNRASNSPYKKHHHPRYVPLKKTSNSSLLDCTTATDLSGKGFIKLLKGDCKRDFIIEDEHLN